MSVIVRPYRESDFESFGSIFNAIVERGDAFVYDHALSPQEMQDYLESYSETYVAELDGQIVGGYLIRPNQPGRGAHVANATCLVADAARGQGIGKLLGEHSLATCRQRGFVAMQFNAVVSSNAAAIELWKRLGFEIIRITPAGFRQGDGRLVDLYIMHRRL